MRNIICQLGNRLNLHYRDRLEDQNQNNLLPMNFELCNYYYLVTQHTIKNPAWLVFFCGGYVYWMSAELNEKKIISGRQLC